MVVNVDFFSLSLLNKAASDPLRLEILRILAQDSYGVQELCEIFDHKQSGMSHHLKVLADATLVSRRREGNSIFYSRALIADGLLGNLQQQLYQIIDAIPVSDLVKARLEKIKQERTNASRQFFSQQSDKFKAQQDLIADYPVYGEAVEQLLQKTLVVCLQNSNNVAVEIGPGAGEFLPVLANYFGKVLALDNAATMLDQAQSYSQQQGCNNIEFVCADTQYLSAGISGIDCVVMNMVLHHTPSPANIFADVANCLRPGGVLLVTDLCRHDQDWAKSACGDLWLGFDPDELQRWAISAGMEKNDSNYFALRNGFQIQQQQFIKTGSETFSKN